MRPDYEQWLEERRYEPGTITARLHGAGRVEECYGDLEKRLADGAYRDVIDDLSYAADDERQEKAIDVTCRDDCDDALVVIEREAGKADSRAIGQLPGYMGDLAEEEGCPVRGILSADEFDARTRSAARVVRSLTSISYAVEFRFERDG